MIDIAADMALLMSGKGTKATEKMIRDSCQFQRGFRDDAQGALGAYE
jgi:hypothetical protein